jgi:hypothetical protein
VIQEELKQRQVVVAQMPPQEQVASQPVVELLHQRRIFATAPTFDSGLLALELGSNVDGFVGSVFQVTDQRPDALERMENITPTGTPR